MNQEFEQGDLDTVDYYYVVCGNFIDHRQCGKYTTPVSNETVAAANAIEAGFKIEDGCIYCADCAELELQRQEEERIEEEAFADAVKIGLEGWK